MALARRSWHNRGMDKQLPLQSGLNGEGYEARVNRAIALIDAHIDTEIDLETLADAACLSAHHFHRVFKSLVGETVHEFTTRLRLERGLGLARLWPPQPWKRIAAACGYRSPAVFSRAFKRRYGVNPAKFDLDTYWQSRPDAAQAASVSAYFLRPGPVAPEDFKVELVHRSPANLIGSRAWGAYVDPSALLQAYERLVDWAEHEGMPIDGGRLAGASRDDPDITPLSRCRYDFMLEVPSAVPPPPGLFASKREAGWWAVHALDGEMSVVDRVWNVFFKSWLPASGLSLREEPAEEVYRKTPAEIGWERFDLLCCVPVHHVEETRS